MHLTIISVSMTMKYYVLRKEIIDRIAVVNVKKSNGGSESEYEDLKNTHLKTGWK